MSHDNGSGSNGGRQMLRHALATLAYRAEKVLRETPEGFADFKLAATGRTPLEILGHMADLMEWGERFTTGVNKWQPGDAASWDTARDRFFRGLAAFDAGLAANRADSAPLEVMFQGPVADALTHVGQLSMIRGAAGLSVRPESYARAEIKVGRTGLDQSSVRTEFDGDASKYRK